MSFYATGGTLRYDAPSYVERQADRELLAALLEGEFCYILTSRQMGKSSLMVRTAKKLRKAQKAHVAVLDLTAVGQNVTPEQWYDGLLMRTGRQLDLEDELEDFWLKNEALSPVQRYFSALQEVALAKLEGPLIIFVDELDMVRSLPFSSDEFFAAIRECYNRRADEERFQRLTFCLLGVATPSDLIKDPNLAPFNIGRRIVLDDFESEEAENLAEGLKAKDAAQGLLQRIFHWTHGHPYLTQRLCRSVGEANEKSDELETARPGLVDRFCERLFLSTRARERDDNLLFVRERMLRGEQDRASVLDIYGKVRDGKRITDDETNPLVSALRLAGITRVMQGFLKVRNRIYRRVFDSNWVKANMPDAELRRQKEAFKKGLIRATAGALAILAIILTLTGIAIHHWGQAQQRLIRLNTANGVRMMQQDNRLGSLLWFAENLKLPRIPQDQETLQRYRFASLLQGSPKLTQFLFHSSEVRYAEFSPDERWVISAGEDKTARIWDMTTGDLVYLPLEHDSLVNMATFSPDGSRIITATAGQTAHLWDAVKGTKIGAPLKHDYEVLYATFSPQGDKVVTASFDNHARIWDATTGQPITDALPHKYAVVHAAFSPTGEFLATSSTDSTAIVWDVATGQPAPNQPPAHEGPVATARFSPDGGNLITASADGTAIIWNILGNEGPTRILEHKDAVTSASFSPNGELAATGCRDGFARIWDRQKGILHVPPLLHEDDVESVTFSPDGQLLLTVSADDSVRVWEVDTGQLRVAPLKHNGAINHAAFSRSGHRIITASSDQGVRVWDLASMAPRTLGWVHQGEVTSFAFSLDGQKAISAGTDGVAKVRDTRSGTPLFPDLKHDSEILSMALSSDGNYLVTTSFDNTARLWDIGTGKMIHLFRHDDTVGFAVFNDDSTQLITASRDKTAKVWDIATGRVLLPPLKHSFEVVTADFSPNGRQLITSSSDNATYVWNAFTGVQLLGPLKNDYSFGRPRISPGGRLFVAANSRTSVQAWDLTKGKRFPAEISHKESINYFDFDSRGNRIITASADYTARVWDPETGQPLTPALNHRGEVLFAAFSKGGQQIVTTSEDRTARIWSISTGQPLSLPFVHKAEVSRALFGPDDRQLLTASGNQVRLWKLPREQRPKTDLILQAELLAGERRDTAGNLISLTERDQRQAWETLTGKYPELFRTNPEEIVAWHRQAASNAEQATNWFAAVFHLKRLSTLLSDDSEVASSLRYAQSQIDEGSSEAEPLSERIPTRDPNTAVNLIDLSQYYNSVLTNSWQATTTENNTLSVLGQGIQTFGDVSFDVRGIVQLSGLGAIANSRRSFPKEVTGIQLKQTAKRIHVLHATAWTADPGSQIGTFVLRYADGHSWAVPIAYGIDVRDWWVQSGETAQATAQVVWQQTTGQNRTIRLFKSTIESPIKNMPIESMEYRSEMTQSAPFLIAITVER